MRSSPLATEANKRRESSRRWEEDVALKVRRARGALLKLVDEVDAVIRDWESELSGVVDGEDPSSGATFSLSESGSGLGDGGGDGLGDR